MSIQIINLNKTFDGVVLYHDFSLVCPEGTLTCILGPSGCGKTTLLNMIGGIVSPDSGELRGVEGKALSYIFQEPRLLPWKTVRENIEFVISRTIPPGERAELADGFIRLVELEAFSGYYPGKLSGGMRQRVAIARAFAYPSDLILMDEPLKGLDVALKRNLIRAFSRLWQNDRRTVVFVTHDVEEALLLGNEIVVFSKAPVEITLRQEIDLPLADRVPESEWLQKIKRTLIDALG
ncbi:MAG TPA: ATP-binding cassette domain-containing protein [Prolixibacteraceae bacterium]|nr:ATP-binding cassette domain-containing protein [Prolixibacteraceae bacterium]